MTDEVLVRAEHICKYFKIGGGRMLHAVEDVNLDIHRGETLGLVGESGCGKSTLGRTLMGIYQPTKGKLIYDGKPVDLSNKKERFAFAKKAQIVFQDPYASLDPRMTVGSIIEEGMIIHNMYDAKRRQERVAELLATVGLNREHANRFPHEFSGGQRQRIGIARALAIEPEFIVCDEPISALDVSIQAQVINLLHDLQERMGLTYLFIAHDLNIVKYISDRIAVMYLGSVVELATSDELYAHTLHPYDVSPDAPNYGALVAAALGVPPEHVFKTLIADVDGALWVAVVPVVAQLDLKGLAAAAGGKRAAMAEVAAAERSSGYVHGGISPLGQRKALPTVVDETALLFDTVFVSGGRRACQGRPVDEDALAQLAHRQRTLPEHVAVRELSPSLASSFAWIEEATLFALAWLVFVGLGLALERRRHIAMTALLDRFPDGAARAVEAAITSDIADEQIRGERGFRTTARRRKRSAQPI